jgi:hypothetical protein
MKNFIITIICLCVTTSMVKAQCSQKIVWNASKAEFLDSNGAVERTMNEKVVVTSSKTEIELIHSDKEDDALRGQIKDFACNWAEPFKNGKTVIKADLAEGSNNNAHKDSSVTIEGKDGKITIVVAMKETEGKKVKIYVDDYKKVN